MATSVSGQPAGAQERDTFTVVVATAVDGITGVLEEHGVYRDDHGGFNYGSRCRGRGCGNLRFANDDAAARHQAEFVLAHLRARS